MCVFEKGIRARLWRIFPQTKLHCHEVIASCEGPAAQHVAPVSTVAINYHSNNEVIVIEVLGTGVPGTWKKWTVTMTRDHLPAQFHNHLFLTHLLTRNRSSCKHQHLGISAHSHGLGRKAVYRQTCLWSASQAGWPPQRWQLDWDLKGKMFRNIGSLIMGFIKSKCSWQWSYFWKTQTTPK